MDFYQSFKVRKLLVMGHVVKYEKSIYWLLQVGGEEEEQQIEIENSELVRLEKSLQQSLIYVFNSLLDDLSFLEYPSPGQLSTAQ